MFESQWSPYELQRLHEMLSLVLGMGIGALLYFGLSQTIKEFKLLSKRRRRATRAQIEELAWERAQELMLEQKTAEQKVYATATIKPFKPNGAVAA